MNQQHREELRPLLARRDELITLFARNDPAAAHHLSTHFPVIWSIIGAALFVAVISLISRRRV
ncbi:MAG: hypothetical protein MSG64_17770 [Pyrinomonadaceae bacterium MAG19_C2-C3]|nr:hypothetical protein [Pyrinomonadaceae bacterium MAG19_C2-C3]